MNGLAEREIEEGERKQLLKKNSSEAKGLSIATGGMVENEGIHANSCFSVTSVFSVKNKVSSSSGEGMGRKHWRFEEREQGTN